MEKIDVSAELLTIDTDRYYADWAVAEVDAREDETIVEIAVSGFQDADYVDMTPIFDVLEDSEETVGDRFFLKEIQFNASGAVATIVLTNTDNRVAESLTESYEVSQPSGRFYCLDEDVLQKINYADPPLLVGYRGSDARLSIEHR